MELKMLSSKSSRFDRLMWRSQRPRVFMSLYKGGAVLISRKRSPEIRRSGNLLRRVTGASVLAGLALGASTYAFAQSTNSPDMPGSQPVGTTGHAGPSLSLHAQAVLLQAAVQQELDVYATLGTTPNSSSCAAAISKADSLGRTDLVYVLTQQCNKLNEEH